VSGPGRLPGRPSPFERQKLGSASPDQDGGLSPMGTTGTMKSALKRGTVKSTKSSASEAHPPKQSSKVSFRDPETIPIAPSSPRARVKAPSPFGNVEASRTTGGRSTRIVEAEMVPVRTCGCRSDAFSMKDLDSDFTMSPSEDWTDSVSMQGTYSYALQPRITHVGTKAGAVSMRLSPFGAPARRFTAHKTITPAAGVGHLKSEARLVPRATLTAGVAASQSMRDAVTLHTRTGPKSFTTQNTTFQARSHVVLHRLTVSIRIAILRGVAINKVLAWCGDCFKSSDGSISTDLHSYEHSSSVEGLDDFISHDWGSGRWKKLFVLLLIYNGAAAIWLGIIAAMMLSLIELGLGNECPDRIMPRAAVACPFVYAFVLFFWQTVRAGLRLRTKHVFVDKFCIDQSHVGRKQEGIRSLAGFLASTDRLIICWSPRYFSRLWCTYELATWKFLGKSHDDVLFMPVPYVMTIYLSSFVITLAEIALHDNRYPALLQWIFMLGMLPICHGLRRIIKEMHGLPAQIEAFSVKKAACFCCTNNHIDPGTGEAMPCDRELVYEALRRWFPLYDGHDTMSDEEIDEYSFNIFDEYVHKEIGPRMLANTGPFKLRYRHILLCGLVLMFSGFDDVVVTLKDMDLDLSTKLLEQMMLVFFEIPVVMAGVLWTLDKVDGYCECAGSYFHCVIDTCKTLILALLFCVFIWSLFKFRALISGSLLLLSFTALVETLIALSVFNRRFQECFCCKAPLPRGDSLESMESDDEEEEPQCHFLSATSMDVTNSYPLARGSLPQASLPLARVQTNAGTSEAKP